MTTKLSSLGLALALALSGCGDNLHGTGGDGSGSGSGSDQPQPEPTLDATGTYRLHSTFDVATNLPGNAGGFVNGLIAATDGPDDPMQWLLDQMLAQMPSSTFKDVLTAAEPFVVGYLNDRLTALAPQLVATLLDVGHRMADLTKHLGVEETLAVSLADQVFIGRVTADGVRFKVDTNEVPLVFADYGIADVVADGVLVSLQNQTRLGIGDHSLPLPYGKLVRLGLDTAIIPAIDPTAHGLSDLLAHVVDCQGVGSSIATALGFGSAAFWASACNGGLDQAANLAYDQLAAPDEQLDLHLVGDARATDKDHDYKLDTIEGGLWTGTMTYQMTDAPLAQPATFVGTRL